MLAAAAVESAGTTVPGRSCKDRTRRRAVTFKLDTAVTVMMIFKYSQPERHDAGDHGGTGRSRLSCPGRTLFKAAHRGPRPGRDGGLPCRNLNPYRPSQYNHDGCLPRPSPALEPGPRHAGSAGPDS